MPRSRTESWHPERSRGWVPSCGLNPVEGNFRHEVIIQKVAAQEICVVVLSEGCQWVVKRAISGWLEGVVGVFSQRSYISEGGVVGLLRWGCQEGFIKVCVVHPFQLVWFLAFTAPRIISAHLHAIVEKLRCLHPTHGDRAQKRQENEAKNMDQRQKPQEVPHYGFSSTMVRMEKRDSLYWSPWSYYWLKS